MRAKANNYAQNETHWLRVRTYVCVRSLIGPSNFFLVRNITNIIEKPTTNTYVRTYVTPL